MNKRKSSYKNTNPPLGEFVFCIDMELRSIQTCSFGNEKAELFRSAHFAASVSRILFRQLAECGHLSGMNVAVHLKRLFPRFLEFQENAGHGLARR
jgi:ribosomal protein S14